MVLQSVFALNFAVFSAYFKRDVLYMIFKCFCGLPIHTSRIHFCLCRWDLLHYHQNLFVSRPLFWFPSSTRVSRHLKWLNLHSLKFSIEMAWRLSLSWCLQDGRPCLNCLQSHSAIVHSDIWLQKLLRWFLVENVLCTSYLLLCWLIGSRVQCCIWKLGLRHRGYFLSSLHSHDVSTWIGRLCRANPRFRAPHFWNWLKELGTRPGL